MTNEQIEAMANWTLEDVQKDALAAVEQVRELATSCLALQGDRDAAVRDLAEYGHKYGFTCEVCGHKRDKYDNPCHYPADVDVDDEMCLVCDRCPCGHCDGSSEWEWRGWLKGA